MEGLKTSIHTCFAKGCKNKVQHGKVYFQDLDMKGFNVEGLPVRCMIKLCKECDTKLHKMGNTLFSTSQ